MSESTDQRRRISRGDLKNVPRSLVQGCGRDATNCRGCFRVSRLAAKAERPVLRDFGASEDGSYRPKIAVRGASAVLRPALCQHAPWAKITLPAAASTVTPSSS